MTWVVGMPGMLGLGVGLSDICVSYGNGLQRDCLQKIYPVGRFIALGFAGSVKIGFAMRDRLTELLQCEPGQAWDPTIVAEWWPADARKVFEQFPPEYQESGCEIMLVSVNALERAGEAPWPRSYVHIFRAPGFECQTNVASTPVAIGIGAAAEPYKRTMDKIARDEDNTHFGLLQAEVAMPGGMGAVLGLELGRLVEKYQEPAISAHFHICVVRGDGITIGKNDHRRFATATTPEVAFRMPPVATSWKGLEQLLAAQGLTAEQAVT